MFDKIYNLIINDGTYNIILKGLLVTIKISFFAVIFGTILGLIICAIRMSKSKILNAFAKIYIAVLLGSPLTMFLMLLYYVVFAKSGLDALVIAIITFAINMSAYVAEMMRSSLSTVNKREIEAARTLGFSSLQAFFIVAFPQAVGASKPVYRSTIINLIQWTSVVGYVTITDLTRVINNTASRTMEPLFMIIVGMVLYIAISYLVTGIFALTDIFSKLKNGGKNNG